MARTTSIYIGNAIDVAIVGLMETAIAANCTAATACATATTVAATIVPTTTARIRAIITDCGAAVVDVTRTTSIYIGNAIDIAIVGLAEATAVTSI